MDADELTPPVGAGVSRRTVLLSTLAAAGVYAVGDTLFSGAAAFASTAPQSAADMAALAKSLQGRTLAQLQANPMTDSPWNTYQGDWCAVFGSWLLRATGVGYQTLASGLYAAAPAVSSPQVGDIIHYPNEGHVGVVVGVNADGTAQTIEGNGSNGANYPWYSSFVCYHTSPWASPVEFSRPTYPAQGPSTPVTPIGTITEEEDVEIYIRRIATGEVGVFGSSFRAATGGTTGRHIFGSVQEYTNWCSILNTYNGQIDSLGLDPRGKVFVPPAAPGNVMGVDEGGWGIVCGLFGV